MFPLRSDFGGKKQWKETTFRVRDKEQVMSRNTAWSQHYIFRGISKVQHYNPEKYPGLPHFTRKNICLYWKYIYYIHFDNIWFNSCILCMCLHCWLYQQTVFKNLRFFCKNYFIFSISQIYIIFEFDKLKTSQ